MGTGRSLDVVALRARAAEVERLHRRVGATWQALDDAGAVRAGGGRHRRASGRRDDVHVDALRDEHALTVVRWNDAVREFYAPVWEALRAARAGDPVAVVDLVAYLEADPRCFRSGYTTADAMRVVANRVDLLPEGRRAVLRGVVVDHVREPRAGLTKPTGRLAAAVWDDALAAELQGLTAAADDRVRRVATQVLGLAANRLRSERPTGAGKGPAGPQRRV